MGITTAEPPASGYVYVLESEGAVDWIIGVGSKFKVFVKNGFEETVVVGRVGVGSVDCVRVCRYQTNPVGSLVVKVDGGTSTSVGVVDPPACEYVSMLESERIVDGLADVVANTKVFVKDGSSSGIVMIGRVGVGSVEKVRACGYNENAVGAESIAGDRGTLTFVGIGITTSEAPGSWYVSVTARERGIIAISEACEGTESALDVIP
jgi:hypothetical protein